MIIEIAKLIINPVRERGQSNVTTARCESTCLKVTREVRPECGDNFEVQSRNEELLGKHLRD